MNKKNLNLAKFPDNFLWGVSTSAYQIEGGNKNDWSVWEKSASRKKDLALRGEKLEEFISGEACNSWQFFEQDFDLIESLNCNVYRMGLEWSRIEPEEGKFDKNVIQNYKKMFISLKKRNIKLALTLWHWTNPTWISEADGWTNHKTVNFFARFSQLCVDEFGDYVDFWVVLNEPMIHIGNGYLTGKFPPNRKFDIIGAFLTRKHLILAQKKVYEIIHNSIKQAQVGFTSIANFIEPAHKFNIIELILAKTYHWWWNVAFLKATKDFIDYVAFDYYFHDRIVWYPPFRKNLNNKVTDMGWEIYPKGIYEVIKSLSKFKKPLYIMENGLADSRDQYRADFIRDHLFHVKRAIDDGFDVRGYFHWSLLDNFEWAAGYQPKFGLFSIEPQTFKRLARPSAKIYAETCKNNGFWSE
ncbi:MAG: glycoside hydrolase family 1 protein [bacterium]